MVNGNLGVGINPAYKLHVNGTSYLSGNTTVVGNQNVTAQLTTGSLLCGGPVTITGTTSTTTLNNSGNATIGGTLGVTGATTTSSLSNTGNATVGGTFSVTGATTTSSLNNTGNATVGGTLTVTGNSTFNSTVSVPNNNIAAGTLQAQGNSVISTDGTHIQYNRAGESETFIINNRGSSTNANAGIRFGTLGPVNSSVEWMRINHGGNVGIATNPQYRLDVNGVARISSDHLVEGNLGINTANPLYRLDVTGVARVSNDHLVQGSLGIGTLSPSSLLHVISSATAASQTLARFLAPNATTFNQNFRMLLGFNESEHIKLGYLRRSIGFNGDNAFVVGHDSLSDTQLQLTRNGFLGIGLTTAPTARLHVAGSSNLQGNVTIVGDLTLDTSTTAAITSRSVSALDVFSDRISCGDDDASLLTTDPGSLRVKCSAGSSVVLARLSGGGGSGNQYHFDLSSVNSGGTPTNRITIIDDGNFSGHMVFATKTPGAVANPTLERMRLTNTGNLGLGVSSPFGRMHLANSSNTTQNPIVFEVGTFHDGSNTGVSAMNFNGYSTSSGNVRINTGKNRWRLFCNQNSTTDYFSLDSWNGTQNLEVLRALNNGFLGINNADPKTTLDVQGTGTSFAVLRANANDTNCRNLMNSIGGDCSLWPVPSGSSSYQYFRVGGTNYRIVTAGSTFFTGQHACKLSDTHKFIGDKLDEYVGLIVSSSDEGCYSVNPITKKTIDKKDSIQISEALPIVKLSQTDRDKAVFGVISNWKNDCYNTDGSRDLDTKTEWFTGLYDRIRVNSVGEGAMWVVNTNGDLDNGDYICSAFVPGYGRKQDDDVLHNYTVAKATISCKFELASTKYLCQEFQYNGKTYRKAFISCTYHCG